MFVIELLMMIIKTKSNTEPKVLVHLHLYYHNQLDFMLKKLSNICNCNWDLYVTICNFDDKIVEKIKKFKPDAKIIQLKNKGYDIWPFIQVLNNVELNNYDYILKIHTKNFRKDSEFFETGYIWRDYLINGILKNKRTFKKNLNILNSNPKIGLIGSKPVLVPMGNKYSEDTYLFEEICRKYNLPVSKGEFISGTMFLTRANCFEMIKNMNLNENDFCQKQETSGKETLAHVVERLLTRVVAIQGYEIYGAPYSFFKDKIKFVIKNIFINGKKHKEIVFLSLKFLIN